MKVLDNAVKEITANSNHLVEQAFTFISLKERGEKKERLSSIKTPTHVKL